MSAFAVTPIRCDTCAGTGEVGTTRDPQSPTRRCAQCRGSGVGGWEIGETSDSPSCLICGSPVRDYVPVQCCDGTDCACRGQPIDPPICSQRCYDALMAGTGKPYHQRRTDAGIAVWKAPLIGILPARGTIDKAAAETFAACLETVPGREVEAAEHFAETECYPDFMIDAMGPAEVETPAPSVGGGGR